MKFLYIGWVGFKNVGDEILFKCFENLVKENLGESVIVKGGYFEADFSDFEDYDVICLGGGSVLLDGYISILYRALEAGKKIMVWGSGYDELTSVDFIDKLENLKIPAYVYSDITEERLDILLEKSICFFVRGPITYKILKKSNLINERKIVISGDPVFLMKKDENFINPLNFSKGDKVVGINLGTSFNHIYGQNEAELNNEMKKVVESLVKGGYKIYLYSLWNQDIDTLINFYNSFEETSKIILDIENRTGEEVLGILQYCEFSINFKLHGNVISSVAEIPFICLGYRLKSYDFMKSLDCEELMIPTGEENIAEKILEKVKYIESNKVKIVEKIKNKINNYRKILRKTFENL
ncbi:MAG: polysaccharide pyruvyl transferase family protein [Sarcina sp.]